MPRKSSLRFDKIRENQYSVLTINGLPQHLVEKVNKGEVFGFHVGLIELTGDLWTAFNDKGNSLGHYSTLEEAQKDMCLRNGKLKSKIFSNFSRKINRAFN